MDYSKQIFNKSLRELIYDDVATYFQEPREENENLEFKSGQGDFEGVFVNNIIRTIAAFLNSSGGLLIWGAPNDLAPEKGKPKVCKGDLIPLAVAKEKDHLINRISSAISYMPTGIHVERLEKDGNYIYIFEIDESNSKPHQYQGKYFIRLDGQSQAAPHYFVDALFNQVKHPQLDGRIDFTKVHVGSNGYIQIWFTILIFNKTPFINEKNVSYQLIVTPGFFNKNESGQYFSEPHKILHYGRPYRDSHMFCLPYTQRKTKKEIKISIAFGGEIGPALNNYYEINIDNLKTGPFDFKNQIINFSENLSFKEKREALGASHEDSLKMLLHRNQ